MSIHVHGPEDRQIGLMSNSVTIESHGPLSGGSFPASSLDANTDESIIILPEHHTADINSMDDAPVVNGMIPADDLAQQMQWSMVEIHDSFGADMSLEEAITTTKKLMTENKELKELISQLNGSVYRAQKVMVDQKDKATKDREEKATQYELARQTVTTLRDQVKEKDDLISDLQTQAEEFRRWRQEERATPSMQAHISQTESDLAAKTAEVQALQEKLAATEQAISAHAEELQSLKVNNINHEESIKKLNRVIEVLEVEKTDLVAMNNDLETQCAHYRQQEELAERAKKITLCTATNDFVVVSEEDTEDELKLTKTDDDLVSAAANLCINDGGASSQDAGVDDDTAPLMSLASRTAMSDLLVQFQQERDQNNELSARLTEAQIKIQELQKQVAKKEQESQVVQVELEKSESYLETAKQLQSQVDELQKEQANKPEVLQTLRAQNISLMAELHEKSPQLTAAESNCAHFRERCRQSEERCRALQEEGDAQRAKDNALMQTLQTSVTALEEDLRREREKSNSKNRKTKEIHQQFDKLAHDYKKVMDAFDQQEKKLNDLQQENTQLRRGNVGVDQQEENDLQRAQVLSLEEGLTSKDREIQQMKRELLEAKDMADKAAVLQLQAEVYKKDFEDEKKEGEQLKKACDQLTQQLQALQTYTKQMQEKMDANMAHRLQYGTQPEVQGQHRVLQSTAQATPQQTYMHASQPMQQRYNYNYDGTDTTDNTVTDGTTPFGQGTLAPPRNSPSPGAAAPQGIHNPFASPQTPPGEQGPTPHTQLPSPGNNIVSDAEIDASGVYWCVHCPADNRFRSLDENAMYRHNLDIHGIFD